MAGLPLHLRFRKKPPVFVGRFYGQKRGKSPDFDNVRRLKRFEGKGEGVKTIGRCGSSSEYAIFSVDDFIHRGQWHHRDVFNRRCYRLEEPCGFYSRIGREGGMARRRISAALFAQLLNECKERISKAEIEEKRIFGTEKGGAA